MTYMRAASARRENDMAGGKNAEFVPCLICLADDALLSKATRTYEGDESDEYHCEKGHDFAMDWSAGPAKEPQWPVSEALQMATKKRQKASH